MLSGDLRTMSLADLLQWADGTRAAGVLSLRRPAGPVWLELAERHAVACSAPPRAQLPLKKILPPSEASEGLELDPRELALELLFDQFLDSDDGFRFEPGAKPQERGVALELPIQELVMEGMRHLDEWGEVRNCYHNGRSRMRRVSGAEPASLNSLQRALLAFAESEPSLNDVRLRLGLSQPSLLRNVEMLRRLSAIVIDGAPEGGDLTEQLIRKAALLLREKQFEETLHVLSSLLSAEPGSRHIRELLLSAERAQVEDLYGALPKRALVRRHPRLARLERRLTHKEREVVALVDGQRDVGTLVLVSPLREAETLKALRKLHRLEAVELTLAQGASRSVSPPPVA